MGTINKIPPGAMLEIFNRKGDAVAAGALLEDFSISTTSEYKQVITDAVPDAFNWATAALDQATKGAVSFSGVFKQFGASLWSSTNPATFNFSLEFYYTYNALEEVSKPIARLKRLVVPGEAKGALGKLGNLIPPGPTILDALGVTDYTSPKDRAPAPDAISVPYKNNESMDDSVLSVRIGSMTFDRLVITSAEPTMSKNLDEGGYPIYGRVALMMQTLYIPSKRDVAHWFGL